MEYFPLLVLLAVLIASLHPKKKSFSLFTACISAAGSAILSVALNDFNVFVLGTATGIIGCALGWAIIFTKEKMGLKTDDYSEDGERYLEPTE